MSTRSILITKSEDGKELTRYYKHNDGYPSEMLFTIHDFIEKGYEAVKDLGLRKESIVYNDDLEEVAGNQWDLEWIYFYDFKLKSLLIFGGEYMDKAPLTIMKMETVNPRKEVSSYYEEYRKDTIKVIDEIENRLSDNLEVTINHKLKYREFKEMLDI